MDINVNLDYSPHEYQLLMHLDESRFKIVIGGRRVGKSHSGLQELIKHTVTTPNSNAWWVGQTYKDAKEIGFAKFLEIKDEIDALIKNINYSELHIELINGSNIYFKGCDRENSLRGRGITFLVLDEAAFIKPDVWYKVLRPALSDTQGKAILQSTPNGRNWLFELKERVKHKSAYKQWSSFYWPTRLNPLITEEDLEEARQQLSSQDYRQEYEAEFVTKAGMIYEDFNEENIIEEFNPNPHEYTFYLGMDFGYANPTAVVFMAFEELTQTTYQFDEIYVERHTIEQITNLINKKIQYYNFLHEDIRYCYTDPAGNAEELSSGISPVDYLRNRGFKVDNKGTNVAPGLAMVRSFILNAAGQRRYFVHKRCENTIRSHFGYTYKLKNDLPTEEPDKDNEHDHACDAVRYYFVNKFDRAKFFFSELDQQDRLAEPTKTRNMKRCGVCHKPFLSKTPKTQPPFMCRSCISNADQHIRLSTTESYSESTSC